jgi:hypothetical protein
VRMHLPPVTLCFVLLSLVCGAVHARMVDLEAYWFDTAIGEAALPADLTASAGEYADQGYFLVQTTAPITEQWRASLEGAGATIYGYVPEFTLLVGMDRAAQTRVRALSGATWVGLWHPAYKISPLIGTQVVVSPERLADPNYRLMVRVFRDAAGVAREVESLGCRVLESTDDGFSRRLLLSAPRQSVPAIARVRDVWWIEEQPEFRTLNNVTRWVVQSNLSGQTPIWDHGIHGEGQIATLMDTGLDYNSCWFRDGGAPPGPSHRKVIDYSTYGGDPYDGCDTGHGSHVAGTVCGDQSFVNPGNYNYNGMAYKAKITVQDVGADDWTSCNLGTLNVPGSIGAAFNASYGLGARVHTNSWGSTTNSYDGYSVDVDNAMWNHKDYLVCFANGNSGPSGSTVGSPATAKDCVSVGATQQAPSQEVIASYSSRGPASDNRFKPTVTAPGGEDPVFITSVNNDPGNPPSQTCSTASSPFQGTSMATPAVSGSALDVRQYYVDGFYPNGEASDDPLTPSAALIKATLVSSTDDMGASDIPNNNEGWGRILLDNALFFDGDTRELIAEDVTPGLNTGGTWTRDFAVDDASEPLVVSLVWTDYPGTQGAGVELVNDLDLVLVRPGGTQYLGNVFSGGFSTTGGAADRRNVEECARVVNPPAGNWTVRVTGYNIPHGPQPFAVVVNGAFLNWPPGGFSAVDGTPARAALLAASPNPAAGATTLAYAVPAGHVGRVQVLVVDVAGRVVRDLVDKGQRAGAYRVTWDGLDDLGAPAPAGIYFARMIAGSETATAKIVVER